MEKCVNCDHDCHCDKDVCDECRNDVCGSCEHEPKLDDISVDT